MEVLDLIRGCKNYFLQNFLYVKFEKICKKFKEVELKLLLKSFYPLDQKLVNYLFNYKYYNQLILIFGYFFKYLKN